MNTGIEKTIDPITASLNSLIAIVFPKSTSKSYPLALTVASSASVYVEKVIGGKLMHFVVFGKSKEDAARAIAVLGYVSSWKGVQYFSRGQIVQHPYYISQVIKCYLDACKTFNESVC